MSIKFKSSLHYLINIVMINMRNHGENIRVILWTAFSINIGIVAISLFLKSFMLVTASILFTVLILHIHKRVEKYYAGSNIFRNISEERQTFWQFVKEVLR